MIPILSPNGTQLIFFVEGSFFTSGATVQKQEEVSMTNYITETVEEGSEFEPTDELTAAIAEADIQLKKKSPKFYSVDELLKLA